MITSKKTFATVLAMSASIGLMAVITAKADPAAVPCFDTGLTKCQFAFREARGDRLFVQTEAEKRAAIGRTLVGFIFSSQDVRHATTPSRFVRLGERITRQALTKRFAGYEVRYTKGEDCLTCAVVSGADGQFVVSFAEDGRTVVDIRSHDDRSRDTHGNTHGASLATAIGSTSAQCDAGMDTTCASPSLKGLSYIVANDDRCPITVKEKQPTDIPACSRIAGFQILEIESGATTTPVSSSIAAQLPTELAATIKEITDACKASGLQVPEGGAPGVRRIDLNGDGSQDFLFDSRDVCEGAFGHGCSPRGCYLVVYKQFGPKAYRKVLDELYDIERFISISKNRRLNLIAYLSPGEFGRCKRSRNESCDYLLFWRRGGWDWQLLQ
ncbi:MAG: hypothetical protein ACOY4O_01800 [Pseudomonadota bacterium]